jgi:hypothetical protein
MFPKSNTRLAAGDVCFIPRKDGRYVPFCYVGRSQNSRASFYGAFGDAVVRRPVLEELPDRLRLMEHGLVHIRSYRENNTPIVGNVRARLDESQIAAIDSDINGPRNVGHISRVWGWRALFAKADEIGA